MTAVPRDRVFLAVYVWLERDGKVLALERHHTGYMDGRWCPPAGGVDEYESVSECAIRECREEVGVDLVPGSLVLLHTLHRKTPERRVIDLFFRAEFTGEPYNAEPNKCAQIKWVQPTGEVDWMDYIPRAMEMAEQGQIYSEADFPNSKWI